MKEYYIEHKEEIQIRKRKYYAEHQKELQDRQRKYNARDREKTITILGAKCARCGIVDKRVLEIHHINGDGNRDRAERGRRSVLQDVIKGITEPYELLCANCHLIKTFTKDL